MRLLTGRAPSLLPKPLLGRVPNAAERVDHAVATVVYSENSSKVLSTCFDETSFFFLRAKCIENARKWHFPHSRAILGGSTTAPRSTGSQDSREKIINSLISRVDS